MAATPRPIATNGRSTIVNPVMMSNHGFLGSGICSKTKPAMSTLAHAQQTPILVPVVIAPRIIRPTLALIGRAGV